MTIRQLDHVSYAVADMEGMLAFYRRLGFGIVFYDTTGVPVDDEAAWRAQGGDLWAFLLGEMKVWFVDIARWPAAEWTPDTQRAPRAAPGTMDICWVWDGSPEEARRFLDERDVPVLAGPVERFGGADGGRRAGTSLYFRDPDDNLLELIAYDRKESA